MGTEIMYLGIHVEIVPAKNYGTEHDELYMHLDYIVILKNMVLADSLTVEFT
jgi:hypothetical protein